MSKPGQVAAVLAEMGYDTARLTSWEVGFLDSVYLYWFERGGLSPGQAEHLAKIRSKLEAKAPQIAPVAKPQGQLFGATMTPTAT